MRHDYSDIRDRIPEPPTWFDEIGVPRYGVFSPDRLSNIYADEAVLAEISCQNCRQLFHVAMDRRYAKKGRGLCDEVRLGNLDYGDPPNTWCCGSGPSMSSEMRCVLEYWSRDSEAGFEWQRDPLFEGPATEAHEPADIVSEVLAAIESGEMAIRVTCTSSPNRYELAGRVAAAIAANGPTLVAFPMNLVVVAREMLAGLVPETDIGTVQQLRPITLVPFDKLSELPPDRIGRIIVLTGVSPSTKVRRMWGEVDEQLWYQTTTWFKAATGSVLIEFALAGRRRVIENPNVVIDGWLTQA